MQPGHDDTRSGGQFIGRPSNQSILAAAARGAVEGLEPRRLMAAVSGFTLFNADTDQPLGTFNDGDVVDYAQIGTSRISIVAEADGSTRSVKFGYDGNSNYKVESSRAFSIAGNTGSDYSGWTPSVGEHTLKATAYAQTGASGTAGGSKTIRFRVTDGDGGGSPTPNEEPPTDSNPDPDNRAPSVSLISPYTSKWAAPGFFALHASASDSDGSISKVEFYADGDLVGTATAAPFMASWTDVQAGSYDVVAKAYDNDGASKTSSTAVVTLGSTSGKTIHVSRSGDDDNSGSSSSPVKTINRAARMAGAGDTVLIAPGTYDERVSLRNSGTSEKPITFKARDGLGSVTIDAGGEDFAMASEWSGAAKHIRVFGLVFKNTDNDPGGHHSAVRAIEGWKVVDTLIEKSEGNGLGMNGSNVAAVRVVARDNGVSGIGGSKLRHGLLHDSESYRNNTREFSGSFEGGGGKFTRSDGFVVDKYESHDNKGPGIWFDGSNINCAVRNGDFYDNQTLMRDDGREKIGGIGIFFEISGISTDDKEGAMLADGNYFRGNESWGVCVYSTRNTTVQNNTFDGDSIELKDNRVDPWMIEDLRVVANRFKGGRLVADSPTASNHEEDDIHIDRNVWDTDGTLWRWAGRSYDSLSSIRSALGLERNGREENIDL